MGFGTGRRFLNGYGLVAVGLDNCAAAIRDARVSERSVLRLAGRTENRGEVDRYLAHLTHPATRLVFFPAAPDSKAVVTNQRDGSEFADHHSVFGQRTEARTVRVIDQSERVVTVRGVRERMRYAARIFELFDPSGESVRSIACADDGGRWVFETSGDPLPAEASFNYGAKRKRDRFTHENLLALLAWLGIGIPVTDAFEQATTFELVREELADREWAAAVEAAACTPDQADDPGYAYFQRALGWAPFMETHAESVVWDMTKAVFFNPALTEEAREFLEAARRNLGRRTFERVEEEALASLQFTTSGRGGIAS